MTLLSERTPEPPAKTPGTFKALFHRLLMAHGRKLVIALPYLWLTLLFMLPFLIVFKISLAELALAVPPYTELLSWADGKLNIALNFANYLQLTDDPLYIDAYLQSLRVAAVSTLCCLIIGYPLAWAVAHSKASTRNILLLLVILPSWTSFLIRVYAWMGILKNNGILNNFLMWLGGDRPAAGDPAHQPGGVYRHRLFLSAVYGAANLHGADPAGLLAGGGVAGSGGPAAENLLQRDRAADARRHHRRFDAGVHSSGGRVRDPGTARWAGQHHDRPRAVAGVLQ